MSKSFTRSLTLLTFLVTAFVSMASDFKFFFRYPEREYDQPWNPGFVTDDVRKSIVSVILAKVTGLFWESLDNPLNKVIDAAIGKPVVFGQHVEQYSFHMWGFKQRGADHYKAVFVNGYDQRLRVTFNPEKLPIQDIDPNWICFPQIEKTVNSAENNKNIVTDAACFVADKVEKHEQKTGHGPNARLKERSVAIPTKHGMYYCFKSCLYNHDTFSDKEISCCSQTKFDDMSRHL